MRASRESKTVFWQTKLIQPLILDSLRMPRCFRDRAVASAERAKEERAGGEL